MLVSRGDLVSQPEIAFASAPTACRGGIKTAICDALMYKVQIGNVDVVKAFSHADAASLQALQIVSAPGFVVLRKPERVSSSGGEIRAASDEDFKVTTWAEWGANP